MYWLSYIVLLWTLWGYMFHLKLVFSSFLGICPRVVLLGYYQINVSYIVKSRINLSSVQFDHSVVSDFLWPLGLWHARRPCPSPPPGVYSNSCPLNWWCHSTISSLVVPFSSRLQSFPASGSFPMKQFLTNSRWAKYWSFSISPSN